MWVNYSGDRSDFLRIQVIVGRTAPIPYAARKAKTILKTKIQVYSSKVPCCTKSPNKFDADSVAISRCFQPIVRIAGYTATTITDSTTFCLETDVIYK